VVVAPAALPIQEIPEDGAEPVTAMIETPEATVEVERAKADAAPSTPRLDVPVPPRPLRDPPRIHDRVAAASQDAAPTTTDTDQAGATTVAAQSASTSGSQAATTAPQITISDAPVPLQAAPATSDTPQSPLDVPVETARAPESTATSTSRDLSFSQLSRATIETTAHLAATIARKLEGRSTRFDMVLTPEDLGRVDVSLEIDSDGQLAARLAFDNPAAAADLRSRADELRRQLQDAGFQVTSDSLDFSQRDPSSGGGAFDRQQQRNALFAGGSRLAAQADLAAAPPVGAWANHSLTPDRVDVRV
jgi:flagellar hook-length control protein FliK